MEYSFGILSEIFRADGISTTGGQESLSKSNIIQYA